MLVNGDVSFWHSAFGGPPSPRGALTGDIDVDVAVVGAGYTGLWTAYYLNQADPSLSIAILEKEFAGFGASGRNGGWLSGELGWSRERYASARGAESVRHLQRAMFATVDEVADVCRNEEIDADIVRVGSLRVATTSSQVKRLRNAFAEDRRWGVEAEDAQWLDHDETADRIRIADAQASVFMPHARRVQPAKLVRGLAEAVERRGVKIYEQTTVKSISPRLVDTDKGRVSARYIIRATEGYTASIAGHRRDWLPMNSAMLATAKLSDAQWTEIGWTGGELLADAAHAYMYAQRTTDGRIAIGGRGVPYRFGSQTDDNGQTQPATIEMLQATLKRMFPSLASVAVEHAWCGVLGVPRDWCATVGLDPETGIGWAGGYVGMGVTTSNLAARTLRALVLGDSAAPEASLPWVNRTVRRWEPEPLRWLGVQTLYRLFRAADAQERRSTTDATSPIAVVANRVSGRH